MSQFYEIFLVAVSVAMLVPFFIGISRENKKSISDLKKKHDDFVKHASSVMHKGKKMQP